LVDEVQLKYRQQGFKHVTKVNDALRSFLDKVGNPKIKLEFEHVDRSLGRVLGANVLAHQFIPRNDRATVDGYALRSSDVQIASEAKPVVLRVVGRSNIHGICQAHIRPGQAVAVATGSSIPSGADAIVMVECTKILRAGEVAVLSPSAPSQNISRRGEDVRPGAIVLMRGRHIRPQDIGMLKALGVARIRVVRKPRIGIISTGDELTYSLTRNKPGKVVDINRPALAEMIRELGGVPMDLGLARDEESKILAVLREGVRSCNAVVVTAGSSVGERDLVPRCINRLGRPGMLVHGVAMRPAMPTGLAIVNGTPILSLPGLPVSAILGFRVFGRPLIARLLGTQETTYPLVKAVLKEQITKPLGFAAFMRVTLRRSRDGLVAEPLKVQRSSVLMSLVAANGIATIPEDVATIDAGQQIEAEVIGEITP